MARIADEVSLRRSTVALLTIESRGSAGTLAAAALAGGFDLRRHENILLSAAVPKPKDIYAGTRVLLAPSVWEEPAGRVVAEALVNGIPPIVSDRGGLAEVANDGGFVVPIPPDITTDTRTPPEPSVVEPWVELILRLADDQVFYDEASARERGRAGLSPRVAGPALRRVFRGRANMREVFGDVDHTDAERAGQYRDPGLPYPRVSRCGINPVRG